MDNSKGLTVYNEWFISAIKSSKVDGQIEEKKLLQNCLNCHNQVKTATNSSETDSYLRFEEFRLDSTILLLLGCPCINELPVVLSCTELLPLTKSVPSLDVENFFVVLKGLKNNKYLRGSLPWLPTEVLVELLTRFMTLYKAVTPLSLAISYEIFYSLIYSLQFNNKVKENVVSCMKNFADYLKSSEISGNTMKTKFTGYCFMYIVECIYHLIKYLDDKSIEEPYTLSFGLKFKNLHTDLTTTTELEYESGAKSCINIMSSLVNDIVLNISSDIWISWHDIKAPTFGIVGRPNVTKPDSEKSTESIQTQISHTVYSILRTIDKIKPSTDILSTEENKELDIFFKQIAVDPEYDSDNDLSTLEVIDAIKQAEEARRKKLLTILLNRDDIFEEEECSKFLKEVSYASKSSAFTFIKKFISLLKNDFNCAEDWKFIALELSNNLANEDVVSILKEDLGCGSCNILKTERFLADFTRIFNQLSDQSDQMDTECCDSYLRLCLQSGVEVVKCSIDMVINLPGFSPVLASTLRTISFICRSKSEDGLTLTTKLLMEKAKEDMTPDVQKEFTVFLVHLLKIPAEEISPYFEGSVKDLLPIDVREVFEKLVCPRLRMENEIDEDILNTLDIFKTIVDLYPEVVLESSCLLSSVISLILLHHNCTCLDSSKYSQKLSIRKVVEEIYHHLEKLILKDLDTYKEKIVLLGIHLSHYELHFRSNFLVSQLLSHAVADETTKKESLILRETCTSDFVVDKLFNCNLKKTHYDEESEIPKCTRIEWIWALYIILPDCDESEWLCCFDLTHSYLNVNIGDTNLVTPTLKIFQEVLLLVCDSVSKLSSEPGKRISLSHCFKCFSNASMKFINEKLKEDEHQFYSIINIFTWWCKAQRVLDCAAEYPAILLSQLVSGLSDLLQTKQVVVASEIPNSTVSTSDTPSEGSSLCTPSEDSSLCSSKLAESVEDLHLTSENQKQENENNKENINENGESYQNEINKKQKSSKKKSKNVARKCKLISKKDFEDSLDSIVRAFVSSVRSSEVTSAVAGKLKALCEL